MQGIVPLAYNLKKARAEQLSADSMYQGMVHAYTGGNIGPISNNITKVWNSGEIGEEQLNVVKWLTYTNNQIIDFAKTLWLANPPQSVKNTIKSYTKSKLPNFFIYAKDKSCSQVEPSNNSAMNRIANKIPSSTIRFNKSLNKIDYRNLMNQVVGFDLSKDNPIIFSYDYWNGRQGLFETNPEEEYSKQEDLYVYHKIREKILEDNKDFDIDFIVNTLVVYLYTLRNSSSKKTLWACFGDIIVQNLKNNVSGKERICKVCGKRFTPKVDNQICCSTNCGNLWKKTKSQK